MTDQALDDLARRVILDAARQEYGDLIDELPEHDFSQKFEKKMRKLIRRANHPIRHWVFQAAACLLLAALLSGCTVLAVSPEAREAFVGWVREVYETTFVYHFSGSKQGILEDIEYLPTWVPDGYQQEFEPELYGQVNIIYKHPEKQIILFNYMIDPEGQNFYVGKEDAKIVSVMVRDFAADLYLYDMEDAANILVWMNEEGVLFWISAPLGEDELIRMAESVEPVQVTYRPTWLPEGYEIFDESSGAVISNSYVLGDKEICLAVFEGIESASVYVNMDEGDIEKHVLVLGHPADLYLSAGGETKILFWANDETNLAFILSGSKITEEEMLRIAESVQPALFPEQPHRPAWIPVEYVFQVKSGGRNYFQIHYEKKSGEQILFRYRVAGYDERTSVEMQETIEALIPQTVFVNGLAAQLYADTDGIYHLVWHGKESNDTYWLTAPLTCEEIIKIAESVGATQSSNGKKVIP